MFVALAIRRPPLRIRTYARHAPIGQVSQARRRPPAWGAALAQRLNQVMVSQPRRHVEALATRLGPTALDHGDSLTCRRHVRSNPPASIWRPWRRCRPLAPAALTYNHPSPAPLPPPPPPPPPATCCLAACPPPPLDTPITIAGRVACRVWLSRRYRSLSARRTLSPDSLGPASQTTPARTLGPRSLPVSP